MVFFFFSSRRRHTRCYRDWSSDVCSSDLECIRGNVLEVKDAHYTRRFGSGARSHVVDIDRDNPDADLHADLSIPGGLPGEFFDCVILTQVLQFLSPETALANLWASM